MAYVRQESHFRLLSECVSLLENAASTFFRQVKPPKYVKRLQEHFEYENPDEKIFAVLRCVRVASDFRAIMVLLAHGYVQQVGVLSRGIVEFNHDLDVIVGTFLDPEIKPRVDKRVSEFFANPWPDVLAMMKDPKKKPTIPRKKTYALIEEVLRNFQTSYPLTGQQIVKGLEEAYSGYVHGAYAFIMELYDPCLNAFAIEGMPGRIEEWMEYVALNLHHSLNDFSAIAHAFGLEQLKEQLIEKRRELENSPVYTE